MRRIATAGAVVAGTLALEAPDWVRAVAPVAAGLPAEENLDCRPAGRPVPVLIMNGTRDPMNPWGGGEVALYGLFGNRGAVLSTQASIDAFRELAGHPGAPEVSVLPDLVTGDGSRVEVHGWRAPGLAPVVLYAILEGGHGAPHPAVSLPRLLGPSNQDISAAREIWGFFADLP